MIYSTKLLHSFCRQSNFPSRDMISAFIKPGFNKLILNGVGIVKVADALGWKRREGDAVAVLARQTLGGLGCGVVRHG